MIISDRVIKLSFKVLQGLVPHGPACNYGVGTLYPFLGVVLEGRLASIGEIKVFLYGMDTIGKRPVVGLVLSLGLNRCE
jgi:hypothetical protein